MKLNYRFCLPVERVICVRHDVRGERFEVRFTPATAKQAMRTLGRWAANRELPKFNWYMAACMCNRIQQLVRDEECGGR